MTAWGWQNAKARTKALGRVPWAYHDGRVEVVPVTLQEVIERARALYPDLGELNPATARTWAKRGMWPRALKQVGQGQGKGRVGDYPEESPAELAAAAFLKQGLRQRFKDADIARARQFWLSGGKAQGEEAEAILPGFLSLASYESWFGIGTMESLQRALDIVIYASRLEMARRGMDIRQHIRAEFRVTFSDCPTVAVVLKSIEPTEGRDEIIVTARDSEEPA